MQSLFVENTMKGFILILLIGVAVSKVVPPKHKVKTDDVHKDKEVEVNPTEESEGNIIPDEDDEYPEEGDYEEDELPKEGDDDNDDTELREVQGEEVRQIMLKEVVNDVRQMMTKESVYRTSILNQIVNELREILAQQYPNEDPEVEDYYNWREPEDFWNKNGNAAEVEKYVVE